jgi:hypothetical protein
LKKSNFSLKTLSFTILIGLLLGKSAVWAGELGYGFKPDLVAGKDFVEGQIIVGYREGVSPQALVAFARALGGTVKREIPGSRGAVLLNFGSEAQVRAAVLKLVKHPDVLFVERNGIMRIPPQPQLPNLRKQGLKGFGDAKGQGMNINAVSADPGTGFQYHLTTIRKTAALPPLSATPPTVAVIDTGVDYTHPDLCCYSTYPNSTGRVILGKNTVANNMNPFDDNGHGTHVAGLIAAKAGNAAYGEGVCPNCKILVIKVMSSDGSGTFFDIADGMAFARTAVTTPPTKVVNMSLGGPDSASISTQVDLLKAANKVLVAAAGNGNTTSNNAFPGADPDTALRVMATEQHDCRAWFSNFSPATAPTQYNIAAPGWKIPSTVSDLGFDYYSGTSMAAPIVAGAAALVWGQLPSLTRDTLVARLLANAKPISCGFAATTKRLDVRKAILGTSETALIGRLVDPFTGKAPSPNTLPATAQIFSGTTLCKSDSTDRGGSYEMTGLCAGARTLKGSRAAAPAYVNASLRGINILANVVNGPYTDALPAARPTGYATITLDWKNGQPIEQITTCLSSCNGWEFDLQIKSPAGVYYGWDNPGNLTRAPYIIHPRDSVDSDGYPTEPTEAIIIGSAANNGIYRVFVDKFWTDTSYWNNSWTNSLASVQMYNGAAPIGTFYPAPPATCGLNRYWHVGNLNKNGASYTWTNVNTCSNTKP